MKNESESKREKGRLIGRLWIFQAQSTMETEMETEEEEMEIKGRGCLVG